MICPEGLEIIDSGKEWGIISICPENMLTTKVRNKDGIMNKIGASCEISIVDFP